MSGISSSYANLLMSGSIMFVDYAKSRVRRVVPNLVDLC